MKKTTSFLFAAAALFWVNLHAAELNRICILGSCSGTEPMPGRHHTAWTLETGGRLYQFDAGENCAHTASVNNIDLLKLRAIFISHPHFDHVNGLSHLLWTRNKVAVRFKRKPDVSPLPVYTPQPQQLDAMVNALDFGGKGKKGYRRCVSAIPVQPGIIFDDGTIKVEALRNKHCKPAPDGAWLSYSYRIFAGNKKIVFSGDMKHIDELDPFLSDCDILLVETGHHHPWEIAGRIRGNSKWTVRKLVFVHHGRDILNHPEESMQRTAKAWGSKPVFAEDAMFIEF
ncbi:MAG: MBL fold metallo-hydrolase [Lentisphaeria bacterium]|nr:MBL fold metallo-hydrolase [Lentisphaeria bacterium]